MATFPQVHLPITTDTVEKCRQTGLGNFIPLLEIQKLLNADY